MRKLAKTTLAASLCAAVLIFGALPAENAHALSFGSSDETAQLPDFVKLVEENGPGVVNISVIKNARTVNMPFPFPGMDERHAEIFRRFGFPFGGEEQIPEQRGTGSGFIISSDGLIMTNAHVVEGADRILVRLTDKREFEGKVLGTDKQTDIAVVKIDAKDLHVLKMGDSSKLKVGQWVAAIGSPFGLDNTVTAGIVSALSRNLPSDQYVPFIQTDVAVNPGNRNEYIVWDCRSDPSVLLELSVEDIARLAFGPRSALREDETRLPLSRLRVNTSPFVCGDLRTVNARVQSRFGIDPKEIVANGEKLTEIAHLLAGPVLEALRLVQGDEEGRA